jgi:hypothetical protein
MANPPRIVTASQPAHQQVPPQLPPCKLLEEMRNAPTGNWTVRNVETLCGQTGLEFKPPRRGSHFKAFSRLLDGMLTIPAKKPIKSIYIKRLVSLADAHRHMLAQGGQ